jgi:5-bromo-4-chloroindolyl phosphate hydrolysis protein
MALKTSNPIPRLFSSGLLLFLLPLPLLAGTLISLFRGDLDGFILHTASYLLFLAGALLNRRGLHNAYEYENHHIARAPTYPLKALGAAATAAGAALTAFTIGYGIILSACFGASALLGCYLIYGVDPRKEKPVLDSLGLDTTDQFLEAIEQADDNITAIEQANREIRNPELTRRLNRISEQGRQILALIEENPRTLRRARKFLNVYLEGTKRVAEGYARTHRRTPSEELEENFRRVLITIEAVFEEQNQKLLEHDLTDLDVQIEVLATQLQREGVI